MALPTTSLPPLFMQKKRKILDQLAVPASDYDDLSPKGSIDEGIRDLIDEINGIDGCVTTSSCAGRISVFVEGDKTRLETHDVEDDGDQVENGMDDGDIQTRAGVGGKGGGGKWLYVSHSPLNWRTHECKLAEFFGMHRRSSGLERGLHTDDPGWERWVHFKFEPMILHILTSSPEQAQIVLSAALQAGFRESGAINIASSSTEPATPMIAVRSMGLGLESIVGCGPGGILGPTCIASEVALECLVDIANERFKENAQRLERFRSLLKKLNSEGSREVKRRGQEGEEWEDAQVRRERKRAEGLMISQQSKGRKPPESSEDLEGTPNLQLLD